MTMTISKPSENPSLRTPSDILPDRVQEIADGLNAVLANVFAMYLKTKNFHWHMSGPHFRDYHLLLTGMEINCSTLQTRSPSAFAKSVARLYGRSGTSLASNT